MPEHALHPRQQQDSDDAHAQDVETNEKLKHSAEVLKGVIAQLAI
ncbi:MAG: hypothetical protein ACLS4Z_08500 [Christensenellaceae bacterium]